MVIENNAKKKVK